MILQNTNTEEYTAGRKAANLEATRIAKLALSGEMDDQAARLAIAGEIESTGVCQEVAAEQFGLDAAMRMDLSSSLSSMMIGRATGTGGFKLDLDLKRIAGGDPAVGWARQLLRRGAVSKIRDLRAAYDHLVFVQPNTPDDNEYVGGAADIFHRAGSLSAEQTIEEDRFGDSLHSLLDIKGLRYTGQTKQEALHLRKAYDITAPIVIPEDRAVRSWLEDQLESTPTLAYASLLQWLAIVAPKDSSDQTRRVDPMPLDAKILDMWNDFTAEDAEDLADRRPGIAHKLALAAVLLAPKPSRDIVKQAIKMVTLAAAGHEWELHATALVEAWIAHECAPFSEFKAKSRGDEDAVLMAYELAGASWPQLARQTAEWRRSPLGKSEDAVARFISRIFTSIDEVNFPAETYVTVG